MADVLKESTATGTFCAACGGVYTVEQLKGLPKEVIQVAAGSGNPTSLLNLRRGQKVLDVGCGGGIDCFLAAKQVGLEGKVIGVDKSLENIRIAKRAAQKMGLHNIEFLVGDMKDLPVEDEFMDVVMSNCVIAIEKTWQGKSQVFKEIYRVLKPGGKLVVSDWVAIGSEKIYVDTIRKAGFRDIEILNQRRINKNTKAIDVIAHKL